MADTIVFAKPGNASLISENATLERLVSMTNQTCIVGCDKALAAIFYNKEYCIRAARVSGIAERLVRVASDVGLCLPLHQRVVKT